MRAVVALVALAMAAGACVKHDPLYCDDTHPCNDPPLDFCDVDGIYPAAEGHGHTCIANPNDAGPDGAAADGGVDAMPDAGCENGATRTCGTDEGPCEFGVETCRSSGTWGPCQGGVVPELETCNMADDDCDGTIDNGTNACGGACVLMALPSSPCDGTDGDVCNEGTWSCATINDVTCSDMTDTLIEDCNTLDDDCDLSVDEGCSCVNGLMQDCGTDTGACTLGMQTCSGGMWDLCSGILPVAETCNGIDDDCDGPIDETFTDLTTPCMVGTGACVATGVMVCNGAGTGTQCGATPGMPATETCNHIDDDCDGVIDNGCPAVPTQRFPWNGYATGSWRANGMVPFGAVNPLKPTFKWAAAAGATSYQLQLDDSCTTPGFAACAFPSPLWDTTLATTLYTLPTYIPVAMAAPSGTRWYWRVRACNSVGCSDWSPVRYLEGGRQENDFNGDGYADAIVGATFDDNGAMDEGNAFVFNGSASGLATTFATRLDNPLNQTSGHFGSSAAALGDVNGDGYSDAVVGANQQDSGAADEGVAYVYYGSAAGLPIAPSVILDNPDNTVSGNFAGFAAGAGDVNGDGYNDLLIGATANTSQGKAYLYLGSAAGIPMIPSLTLTDPPAEPGAYFGAVSSCGDTNGDGYVDVIVGAFAAANPTYQEGNAYVYYGSSSGLTGPPVTLDSPADQASAYFGGTIIPGGDINGDGFSDVVIGASALDNGAVDEGGVYIYYGAASGIPTTPATTLDNPTNQATAFFGGSLAGGDFNDDGFSDLAVGAYYQTNGAMNEGNVFVYLGNAGGISSGAVPSTIDCPNNQAQALFGYSAGVGDFNGNGYDDFLVGAYWYDNPTPNEGSAFVYLGSSSSLATTAATTIDSPDGQMSSRFGERISAVP